MRRRLGRILFLLLAFAALTTIAPLPPRRPLMGPGESLLIATPLHLVHENRDRRRAGALFFRRGWQLESPDPRFGGLSAMKVENDRVTALSDAGVVFEFALPSAGFARGKIRFTPLLGPGPATRKSNRDTEALVVHGGRAWVAFEGHNAIWRYRRRDWRAEKASRPIAIREWAANAGAETLVRLGDGRFLAIAEGNDSAGFSELIMFDGDPTEPGTSSQSYQYRHVATFRPTDAALLPGNRLLVLNRHISLFGGMAAKLILVDLDRLRPGAAVVGREIAELRPPIQVDNMEALSIALEGGRTIVRMASDDNFSALQRTLLLEFELDLRPLATDF